MGRSVGLNFFPSEEEDEALREEDDESFPLREEDDEALREEDDEALREEDDEGILSERFPRIPRSYTSGSRGLRRGTISTGRGRARVRLNQSVVSMREFRMAMQRVRRDIGRNQKAIVKLDKNMTRKYKSISSKVEQASTLPILLTLLQKPPALASITFDDTAKTVTRTEYVPQDPLTSLLPLMLFGGNMFGSQSDSEKGGGGMGNLSQFLIPMLLLRP